MSVLSWWRRWFLMGNRGPTDATLNTAGVTGPAGDRWDPNAAPNRWVVVDVESSGLDAHRDRLLAIAAVAVHFDSRSHKPHIDLDDSFEVFLQQPSLMGQPVDKANILIHRIGVGAQQSGVPPQQALQQWIAFVGHSPLVAYHSAFDETMINRAVKEQGCSPRQGHRPPWLDLEPLCAVLHGDPRRRALDHWLGVHGIGCLVRHHAASDTLATAELLLKLWPLIIRHLPAQGVPSWNRVVDLADAHRFIPGRLGSR